MHYVQTCRFGCWVGISLLGSMLWAVFGAVGCVLAARMRAAGMRKSGPSASGEFTGEFERANRKGKKTLNLSDILFWPYGMCCSWSFPGRGKKLFSSTFSSLIRYGLSLSKNFQGFFCGTGYGKHN